MGEWTVLRFDCKTKHNEPKWICRCSCGRQKSVFGKGLIHGGSKSCGCKNRIDMVGKRFGRLIVIKEVVPHKKIAKWECLCDCGNTSQVQGTDLRRGKVVSCGCYKDEVNHERRTKDMTGKKFGRLTILEHAGSDKHNCAHWLCKCDCGTIKVISGQAIRRGTVISCGCYQSECTRERAKAPEFGEKYKGRKNPSFGIVRHGKGCWYPLPNNTTIWIRSTYEKRVLDCLIDFDIDFEYEPRTFDLGESTYTPDIFMPEYNLFWEIKGYLREKDRLKLEKFNTTFSNININVIQIDDIKELENSTDPIDPSLYGTELKNYLENLK